MTTRNLFDIAPRSSQTGLQVRHRSLAPVMVIGYGSSGTSIAASLLRNYLQIAIGTETQFIVRYYRRLAQYGNLADPMNRRRLIQDLSDERWFARNQKFGFQVDRQALERAVEGHTYREILEAIFRQFAAQLGMQRWGDKTPEYVYALPALREIFPDAKYIHMVRDGRDVTNSVMHRYWGAKNAYVGAHEWREGVALVDHFFQNLPAEQAIEIKYEDLLQEPVETFDRLIGFLEIDDSDGALRRYIGAHIDGDLNRHNFSKWQDWPPRDKAIYERIAGDVLKRHGYETTLDQVDNSFPLWERCYWRLDNKFRKWAYPRYWRDNFYRGSLRVRDAWRWLRRQKT